jgi:fructosamine-3-kinase
MRALAGLLLLAACAAPAAKTVTVTETKTVVVNKYIIIHERRPHSVLLNDYAQTLTAEKPIVAKSKAPAIDHLYKLHTAARAAFEPIQDPYHKATPAELTRAIDALGAMRAFEGQRH